MKPGLVRKVSYVAIKAGIPMCEFKRLLVFGLIREALQEEHGNQCRAAKRLGIHRNTLHRLLKLQGAKQS